jgi:hypothetical protein
VAFVPNGGPQSGFTGTPSGGTLVEYKTFSSPQTGLAITASGGGQVLADALTGSGLTITHATGSFPTVANGPDNTTLQQFTISANAGDYIIFFGGSYYGPVTLDPPYPWIGLSITGSPIGYFDNNLVEYFNVTPNGGYVSPSGTLVIEGTHNLQTNYSTANPGPGVPTYNAPVPGFNNESNYDYNLVLGSAAIGAGTNPGSSPEGYSLVPAYQINYVGLPTPGTPIPPLVARPNTGGVFDAGAFEYGI